jgi:hypothetical protein
MFNCKQLNDKDMKTVIDLQGETGNAYFIMGIVGKILKSKGIDPKPIIEDMMSSGYKHLIKIAKENCGDELKFKNY